MAPPCDRGDPSDKVPGAPGVGATGAAALLQRYGSLEAALKAGRFPAMADTLRLYRLLSEAIDWPADDPRVVEIADIMERLMIRAVEAGELGADELAVLDEPFVDLLDATTAESAPIAERLLEIMEERGWKGWTRIERVPGEDPDG